MSFSASENRNQKLPQNVLFATASLCHSQRMSTRADSRNDCTVLRASTDVTVFNGYVPRIVDRAGEKAGFRFLEYFTAEIRNAGTREAYGRAVSRFLDWCDEQGCQLDTINPIVVSAYIELLGAYLRPPTVKMHLAAIRKMFDFLVVGQIVGMNPAASVRGPKHVVKKGKTPVLAADEARQLLDAIDTSSISGLRDRALIGVMVYSFARVSAVIGMNVEDYFAQGRRMWFRFHEKGGKDHDVPAHRNAEDYLDAYVKRAEIGQQSGGPLFRTINSGRQLTRDRMHRSDVLRMIQRRANRAKIQSRVCCHTMRATGITAYLDNGGLLEEGPPQYQRTTELYQLRRQRYYLDFGFVGAGTLVPAPLGFNSRRSAMQDSGRAHGSAEQGDLHFH